MKGRELMSMEKSFTVIFSIFWLLTLATANVQAGETTQVPPIAQTLVREGNFALQLADVLKVGKAGNEAEAESILISVGIAPKNGWIADYPVTPDIIGELENAVGNAADAGKLVMNRDEAMKTVEDLAASLGLPVLASSQNRFAPNEASQDYGQYASPSVVNNYYYDQGPPIVTYYPPPSDFTYLYSWVPYPFLWFSVWFPGFFVLSDFDRVIVGDHHHGRERFTNHFFDHRSGRFSAIDPARRFSERGFRDDRYATHRAGFGSAEAQRSAAAIFRHTREQAEAGRGMPGVTTQGGGKSIPSPRGSSIGRQFPRGGEGNSSAFRSRGEGAAGPPPSDRSMFRSPGESRPNRSSTPEGMGFGRPAPGGERSFSPPARSGEGSFRGYSGHPQSFSSQPYGSGNHGGMGSERSFGSPSMGGRGSFGGGFHGGSSHMGGFSHGGGCRGRC